MHVTIFAAGALVVSLWWLGRMRRALATSQAYITELEQLYDDGERLMKQQAAQVTRLLKELHTSGHPRFQDPEFHPAANGRQKKGVTR